MAKREELRRLRAGTVINFSSKKMEDNLTKALIVALHKVNQELAVKLEHDKKILLVTIVEHLAESFPEVKFEAKLDKSYLAPDGGIVYLVDKENKRHVVLIAEAKRQGTNDLRKKEGLKRQSKGNAIERLGKNVIGFRTWMATETIFPFVAFCQGVDFEDGSSILDRVTTIAMFAPLNAIEVHNVGEGLRFNRGSFYVRENSWSVEEMSEVMYQIMKRSIYYYFSKFDEDSFVDK